MCNYCEKGEKIPTFCEEDRIFLKKPVKWYDKWVLAFDNSMREYGNGLAVIEYCPMCGRKLDDV